MHLGQLSLILNVISSKRRWLLWKPTSRTWRIASSAPEFQSVHQPMLILSRSIVEESGPRMFGLEESDVMERRRYVTFVKQEIDVREQSLLLHPTNANRKHRISE